MAKVIPNQETWVGFATTIAAADLEPTAAEVTGAIDLTGFIVNIEASSRGNVVATPSLDTLFETSIPGTVTATFTAEMYRDAAAGADDAWDALERGTTGYFIISRFGTGGARPAATDVVEVWPVKVVSRSAVALANNDSQRFNLECSVPVEPNEAAIISA